VADEPNPTAARRELALFFRNLREQRGVGLDQLAHELGVTDVQASRIDRGVRGIGADDVGRLSDWYGLDDAERRRLLALSAESRKRGWWQKVDLGEIGDNSYRTLIGMEHAATVVTEFASGVVPGLLQTPAYARAMAVATSVDLTPEQIEVGVGVRMRRQQILERKRPPRLSVVLDEAVLARGAGDGSVMHEQLMRLANVGERPGITVQVIDFGYGPHPGLNSQFIRIATGGGLPDLVYVEGLRGRFETTDDADVQRYRDVWENLRAIALNPRDSRELILRYAERLTDPRHGGELKEEEQG
jgi:transcriptional regulator with XRE-family HTH domain